MKIIFLLISFFYCTTICAQNYTPSELTPENEKKLQLTNFKNSSDLFDFRFWEHGQAIDIRILPDSTQTGTITNFLRETGDNKIHVQKIELNKADIRKVIDLIEKYSMYDLPTDDSIKTWQPVLDGESFWTEQNIKGTYALKYYGNPAAQKNVPEATRFVNFRADLKKALNLHELFVTFYFNLKVSCFYVNGIGKVCVEWKETQK